MTDAPINKPNNPPQLDMKSYIVFVSTRLIEMKLRSLKSNLTKDRTRYLCLNKYTSLNSNKNRKRKHIQPTQIYCRLLPIHVQFPDENAGSVPSSHRIQSKYNLASNHISQQSYCKIELLPVHNTWSLKIGKLLWRYLLCIGKVNEIWNDFWFS